MSEELIREARDPMTGAERLKELSASIDSEVTRAVCLNPNTPFVILERLWRRHPETYWQNPVVALLQLEDPGFLSRITNGTMESLVQQPEAEEELLRQAVSSRMASVVRHIPKHPRATPELLHQICVDTSQQNYETLLAIASSPKTLSKSIEHLIGVYNAEVQTAALEHPSLAPELVALRPLLREALHHKRLSEETTREQLYLLARCGMVLRQMIVEHSSTTPALCVALLLGGEDPLCISVMSPEERRLLAPIQRSIEVTSGLLVQVLARRARAPMSFLEWIFQHGNWGARLHLAENPALSDGLFGKLAAMMDEKIRLALLQNASLPEQHLQTILRDHNPKIIASALQHPKTKLSLLEPVFHSERWRLRALLAKDTKTPLYVLTLLVEDEKFEVYSPAENNPKTSRDAIERMQRLKSKQLLEALEIEYFSGRRGYPRRTLLMHPQCSVSLIEAFIVDPEPKERIFLASKTSDVGVLARLALDKDFSVVGAVVNNPATTPDLLRAIYQRLDTGNYWFILAKNERTPPDVLEGLYRQGHNLITRMVQNPNLPEHLIREAAKSTDLAVLSVLARNPNAPREIYDKLPHVKLCYIQQNRALQQLYRSGVKASEVSGRILRALAAEKSDDVEFLLWALGSPNEALAEQIAAHPKTPARVLEELYHSRHRYESEEFQETLCRMIKKHPSSGNFIKEG